MHYKNGREAKNGDKILVTPGYGSPYIGILYDAQAGNDFCNGSVAITSPGDPCPNLQECLHLDDAFEDPTKTSPAGATEPGHEPMEPVEHTDPSADAGPDSAGPEGGSSEG